MRYILDMVHHNPGEAPFASRFLDPAHLADYGFNGQVFKHINCVATFAATGFDCFPAGSPEHAWLEAFTPKLEREIAAAKAAGLRVFYHVDLFVLPKRLVEHYRAEICDPATGRILLDRPKTLALHAVLFAELTERFPAVDGYIIRVGETYLMDTPWHTGNSPIPRVGPAWTPTYLYPETLAGEPPADPRWTEAQVAAYITLLQFLRQEICVRHERQLFFRTWDIFPDKLHARLDHYLAVTDAVEPHPRLAFSIKHTALDFWRRVKVNDCLTRGRHPQIIEVQCQREYEGKGAYPNYVMAGVIDGFEENAAPAGLKDWLQHPQIAGVYSWSRGGGWYGPYIQDEFWCDLNAYVLAQFALNPATGEAELFDRYSRQKVGLTTDDAARFRQLCLLAARAILLGRHCATFDHVLQESVLPTALWMRDDRLGGREQLRLVLDYLEQHNAWTAALVEKAAALALWDEIAQLGAAITWPDARRAESVRLGIAYGRRLFRLVYAGWCVLIAERRGQWAEVVDAATAYAKGWEEYRALADSPFCASLYEGRYFNLPGTPEVAGMDQSVHEALLRAQAALRV